MFGLFRKKPKESEFQQSDKKDYQFKWYDIGDDNPFNKRILDIRDLTQNILSFTKDKSVAEQFNKQRYSIGRELIDSKIPASKTINVDLVYPHDGSKIEGTAYKAKCMEDKWDIYGWNEVIYLSELCKSWSRDLLMNVQQKNRAPLNVLRRDCFVPCNDAVKTVFV